MYRDRNKRVVKSDFDDAGTGWSFSCRSARMTRITTRQIRRRRSRHFGEMLIEHTYVDRPASLETWIDHCTALAAEFGLSALEVHRALFAQLPEIFGR
jgi:hypothetical protein